MLQRTGGNYLRKATSASAVAGRTQQPQRGFQRGPSGTREPPPRTRSTKRGGWPVPGGPAGVVPKGKNGVRLGQPPADGLPANVGRSGEFFAHRLRRGMRGARHCQARNAPAPAVGVKAVIGFAAGLVRLGDDRTWARHRNRCSGPRARPSAGTSRPTRVVVAGVGEAQRAPPPPRRGMRSYFMLNGRPRK